MNQANYRFPNNNYKRLRANWQQYLRTRRGCQQLCLIDLAGRSVNSNRSWRLQENFQNHAFWLHWLKSYIKVFCFFCWTVECLSCFICICIKTHTHIYIYILYILFFFGGGDPKKPSNFQWWKWIQVLRFRRPEHFCLLFTRGPLSHFFFGVRFLQGGSGNEWAISILRIHCGFACSWGVGMLKAASRKCSTSFPPPNWKARWRTRFSLFNPLTVTGEYTGQPVSEWLRKKPPKNQAAKRSKSSFGWGGSVYQTNPLQLQISFATRSTKRFTVGDVNRLRNQWQNKSSWFIMQSFWVSTLFLWVNAAKFGRCHISDCFWVHLLIFPTCIRII